MKSAKRKRILTGIDCQLLCRSLNVNVHVYNQSCYKRDIAHSSLSVKLFETPNDHLECKQTSSAISVSGIEKLDMLLIIVRSM